METVKEVETVEEVQPVETVEKVEMEDEKEHSPKPEETETEEVEKPETKEEEEEKVESEEPVKDEQMEVSEDKPETESKTEAENESKTDESSKETEKEAEDKERSERRASRWANNADEKNSSKSDDRRRSDRRGEKRQRSTSGNKRDSRSDRRTPPKNQPAQNTDDFLNEEDEPTIEEKTVGLSWFDSDLHLKIDSTDFSSAKPLSDSALCLTWAGARTNYGVKEGKVLYEVQVTGHNNFNSYPDEKFPYELRCGFSTDKTDLQLGERKNSFAYGGSGQKALNNEFSEYGCTFGLDDVVGVYLDLESFPCTIQYTVNGKEQGIAFEFNKSDLEGEALFPHISSKNVSFKANFGKLSETLLSLVKPKKLVKKVEKKVEEKKVEEKKTEEKEELENGNKEKAEETSEDKTEEETKEKEDSIKEDESEKEPEPIIEKEESSEPKEVEEEKVETKGVEEEKVEPKEDEKIDEPVADKEEEEKATNENSEDVEMKEVEEKKEVEDQKEVEEEETEPEPVVPLTLLPEYEYISKVEEDKLCAGPIRPESRKECEAIMMIGLPGAGKTHWASNLSKENPEKYFNILGTHTLLEKMKVCLLFFLYIFKKSKVFFTFS